MKYETRHVRERVMKICPPVHANLLYAHYEYVGIFAANNDRNIKKKTVMLS